RDGRHVLRLGARGQRQRLVAQVDLPGDADRAVRVVEHAALNVHHAVAGREVEARAAQRQRTVAPDRHAERLRESEAERLGAEVPHRAVAQGHVRLAAERREDLGGRAPAAGEVDPRVQLTGEVGRWWLVGPLAGLAALLAQRARVGGRWRLALALAGADA